MDAKRIIPILQIREGKVLDPPGGLPGACAGDLEKAGADEVIFLEEGPARSGPAAWIQEVAKSLFVPFSVACAFPLGSEVEEALALGADKVILQVGPAELPELARAASAFGRHRLMVAVTVAWTPEHAWRALMPQDPVGREALEWMVELGQMGAGEILLSAQGEEGIGTLCKSAAHLALPVLFRCADQTSGLEALIHGADGLAYAAPQASPAAFKAALGGAGLILR